MNRNAESNSILTNTKTLVNPFFPPLTEPSHPPQGIPSQVHIQIPAHKTSLQQDKSHLDAKTHLRRRSCMHSFMKGGAVASLVGEDTVGCALEVLGVHLVPSIPSGACAPLFPASPTLSSSGVIVFKAMFGDGKGL